MPWITDPQTGNRIWKEETEIQQIQPQPQKTGWEKYAQTEGEFKELKLLLEVKKKVLLVLGKEKN